MLVVSFLAINTNTLQDSVVLFKRLVFVMLAVCLLNLRLVVSAKHHPAVLLRTATRLSDATKANYHQTWQAHVTTCYQFKATNVFFISY